MTSRREQSDAPSERYYYAACGSVRGRCAHRHRTPDAAERCAERDRRECRALPGGQSYSDRVVVAVRREVWR